METDNTFPVLSKKLTLQNKITTSTSMSKLPLLNRRKSSSKPKVYKYKVLAGNNTRVILNSFRKRPWWYASQLTSTSESESNDDTNDMPQFIWQMYRSSSHYQNSTYNNVMLNHLQRNHCLVSKKGLYYCLKDYCDRTSSDISNIIPKTFYLSTKISQSKTKCDDRLEFIQYNQSPNTEVRESDSISDINTNQVNLSVNDIIWIVKPGSNTNRGFGIKVVNGVNEVLNIVDRAVNEEVTLENEGSPRKADSNSKVTANSKSKSGNSNLPNSAVIPGRLSREASKAGTINGWIVQKYLHNPLLVHGRKFDIRCFCLVTNNIRKSSKEPVFKAFFFEDMYVRTSCKRFSLDKLSDRETHLTNDAVQKHAKSYGKFESGNKLTMTELQEVIIQDYLNNSRKYSTVSDVDHACIESNVESSMINEVTAIPNALNSIVNDKIIPEIISLVRLSIQASKELLSSTNVLHSFELFGYDFMVDDSFKSYLIEVNTNPCLEFACPLLTEIISSVIENTFRVAVDSVFPPPKPKYRTPHCQEAIDIIESEPVKFHQIFPEV